MRSTLVLMICSFAAVGPSQAATELGEIYIAQPFPSPQPFETVSLTVLAWTSFDGVAPSEHNTINGISEARFRVDTQQPDKVLFTPLALESGVTDLDPDPDQYHLVFDPALKPGDIHTIATLQAHVTSDEQNVGLALRGIDTPAPIWKEALPTGNCEAECWWEVRDGVFGTQMLFNCGGEYQCCNILWAAGVYMLAPTGGETLTIGDTYEITWGLYDVPPTEREVLLSLDDGFTWSLLGSSASTTLTWIIPDLPTEFGRIKVRPPVCFTGLTERFSIREPVATEKISFGALRSRF